MGLRRKQLSAISSRLTAALRNNYFAIHRVNFIAYNGLKSIIFAANVFDYRSFEISERISTICVNLDVKQRQREAHHETLT